MEEKSGENSAQTHSKPRDDSAAGVHCRFRASGSGRSARSRSSICSYFIRPAMSSH